jgi:2-polyprenyl-6-hydroxyphenyl methylase/3-demethylubiquinone-9 3-methyltransferase
MASFPPAYRCNVLEHVDDAGRIVAGIARVLEPGGVFLYDTVNRTLRSKLLIIKLSQDGSATARADPDLHEFDMFIRPEELEAHLEQGGLEVRDRVGFAAANPAAAVKAMWDQGHGKITYREIGRAAGDQGELRPVVVLRRLCAESADRRPERKLTGARGAASPRRAGT